MKTRIVLMAVLLSLLMTAAPSFAGDEKDKANDQKKEAGGRDAGNGGAGIHRDGRYMTFYTAGLYVEPDEKTSADLSSLGALFKYVDGLKYLTDLAKIKLTSVIMPSADHRYFSVKEDKLDEKTKTRLLTEFTNVTGAQTDGLALFALTDTNAKQTFLLPSFFELSPHDQMTILFHESYWLLNPNSTYSEVVAAELAFQAALELPDDPMHVLHFLHYVGSINEELKYAVQTDIATGALSELLNKKGEISLLDLFGQKYVDSNFDDRYAKVQVSKLSAKYPRSVFLIFLLQHPMRTVDPNKSIQYSIDSLRGCTVLKIYGAPIAKSNVVQVRLIFSILKRI